MQVAIQRSDVSLTFGFLGIDLKTIEASPADVYGGLL